MGTTEPPVSSPYPEGAEPYDEGTSYHDGDEIEVIEVEYAHSDARGVAPFVVAVAAGVVATMVYNGGAWSIGKAWDAGTKQPVIDFTRPPLLYNSADGLTYRLQGNGTYVPSGTAAMQ